MKKCLRCGKTTRTANYCQGCYSKLRKGCFTRELKAKRNFQCEICSGIFQSAALDFHHTESVSKNRTVSNHIARNDWAGAKRESERCMLVCSNCHRVIHSTMTEEELSKFDETKPKSKLKMLEDHHEKIVELKLRGETNKTIGEILGYDTSAICGYCAKHKLKSKWLGYKSKHYDEIIDRRKNGETYQEIATSVGVSKRTAINVVKRFGDKNE